MTNSVGPDADGSAASQQVSLLRSQLDALRAELLKEKEAGRIAAERLKQTEESFEQKEEGYESQIALLNTEIERQATSLESLRRRVSTAPAKARSSRPPFPRRCRRPPCAQTTCRTSSATFARPSRRSEPRRTPPPRALLRRKKRCSRSATRKSRSCAPKSTS